MALPVLSDPHIPVVILYVGPEQIMPLTSLLGAAIGIVLMFWNRVVGLTRRAWTYLAGKTSSHPSAAKAEQAVPQPVRRTSKV